MDPFNAIASLILGKLKDGIWGEWLKFLFELIFSGVVAFLQGFSGSIAAAGAALASGKAPWLTPAWVLVLALGVGNGWAAICMTKKFRQASDKLTKGMSVVLPEAEAAIELADQFSTQTISKTINQEKKQ